MGDLVGDGPVDLVAEPGPDRDGRRRDGAGDDLLVEGREIGAGTATADQCDEVDTGGSGAPECRNDRGGSIGALHAGVDHDQVEPDATLPSSCIAPACAALLMLVTTAMRSGTGSRGSAVGTQEPSPSRRANRRARSAAMFPSVNTGSMPLILSCSWLRAP